MDSVTISLLAVAVLLFVRLVGHDRRETPDGEMVAGELPRLAYYAEDPQRYRVWVSLSVAPVSWVEVSGLEDRAVSVRGRSSIPLDQVRAYVATYPSGDVVEVRPPFIEPLPLGVQYVESGTSAVDHVLTRGDVAEGQKRVLVTFSPSPAHLNDAKRYATHVKNAGKDRVRVVRFGGYACAGHDRFRLHTITGDLFTATDFRQWYGVKEPMGWLNPGEVATDPDNYGGGCGLWAYELEDERGQRFWTGATR